MSNDSLTEALVLHRQGKVDEAQAIYEAVRIRNPANGEAWHLSGVVDFQRGRLCEAETKLKEAISLAPNIARYWLNLGEIHSAAGDRVRALECQNRALELDSSLPQAHNNRANSLRALGRNVDAEASYRRAIQLKPDYVEPWLNLGRLVAERKDHRSAREIFATILRLQPNHHDAQLQLATCERLLGDYATARMLIERLAATRPDWAPVHNEHGVLLSRLECHEDAIASFRKAVTLAPNQIEFRYNLGAALRAAQKLTEAVPVFEKCIRMNAALCEAYDALGMTLVDLGHTTTGEKVLLQGLRLKPNRPDAHNNLGVLYEHAGRLTEAIEEYQKALRINPRHIQAWDNLGNAFAEAGNSIKAVQCFRRAIKEAGEAPPAAVFNNLGHVLMQSARYSEARAAFAEALVRKPNYKEPSDNALMLMLYDDEHSPGATANAHLAWARKREECVALWPPKGSTVSVVKLGFVSGDLRRHPVAQFLTPLLRKIDRQRFRLVAFNTNPSPEPGTRQIASLFDEWHDIAHLSDAVTAELIVAREIDLLFDLHGHTARNRLRLFTLTTRTINVSFLGYPHSTGLRSMHVRLGDPIADPIGAEKWCSEQLVRFPGSAWCLPTLDLDAAWQQVDKPSVRTEFVFGCLNALAKFSDRCLATWSRILDDVPNAVLRLGSKYFGEQEFLEVFWKRWETICTRHGIPLPSRKRIRLEAYVPNVTAHFARYHEIDVALDTMPYNGTTTTCEALLMGVPVLTLAGEAHVSRVGLSLLTTVGLSEFAVGDVDSYVRRAKELAIMGPRVSAARKHLRAQVLRSSLADTARYARDFENIVLKLLRGPRSGSGLAEGA